MKIQKISINGQPQSVDSAVISATNRGVMYGFGAFESFRVSDGKVFLLDEHLDRLKKGLDILGIEWDDDRQKYCQWVAEVCGDTPQDNDAFVRFTVLGGEGKMGISGEILRNPTIIIYVGYIPKFIPIAKRAIVLSKVKCQLPDYFALTNFRIKTPDYTSARIANQEMAEWEARDQSGATTKLDGIMLTPDGYVAEALTSNVFWVKDGQLSTPPLSTGILSGTMRSHIMADNKTEEVLAKPEELEAADEVILTSGASFLNPLEEINGIKKPGSAGEVYKKIYQQLLADIDKLSVTI